MCNQFRQQKVFLFHVKWQTYTKNCIILPHYFVVRTLKESMVFQCATQKNPPFKQ